MKRSQLVFWGLVVAILVGLVLVPRAHAKPVSACLTLRSAEQIADAIARNRPDDPDLQAMRDLLAYPREVICATEGR